MELSFVNSNLQLLKEQLAELNSSVELYQNVDGLVFHTNSNIFFTFFFLSFFFFSFKLLQDIFNSFDTFEIVPIYIEAYIIFSFFLFFIFLFFFFAERIP